MKGLTTGRQMTKSDVCPYRHIKRFNWMRIAITSNSKRDTQDEGLVHRWIKFLYWRKGCQVRCVTTYVDITEPEVN